MVGNARQLSLGEQLRDERMAVVEGHNESWVFRAREAAYKHASLFGTVSMNDVIRLVGMPAGHPNACGSVFRDRRFEKTGQFIASDRPERHSGMQQVWKLKG